MKIQSAIVVLALCLPLSIAPARGGDSIYKWVDQQGVTHYADRPSLKHPSVSLGKKALPYVHISAPPHSIKPAKARPRPKRRRARKATASVDCARLRAEIGKLEANLRQGYTEPAGSRLRARKRERSALLYKHCY